MIPAKVVKEILILMNIVKGHFDSCESTELHVSF